MIDLLHLNLAKEFWRKKFKHTFCSTVSGVQLPSRRYANYSKRQGFDLFTIFSVKSRNAASIPPLRRPVAKGKIVFKTHKLKSFVVTTIGRGKSNAFSLSTKVHLYRMCFETSDAQNFCLFFCCFSLPIRMYDATAALHTCFFVPAWLERISVVDVVYLCDGMGKIIPGSLGNKEEMNVRTTHCSQQATYIVLYCIETALIQKRWLCWDGDGVESFYYDELFFK